MEVIHVVSEWCLDYDFNLMTQFHYSSKFYLLDYLVVGLGIFHVKKDSGEV